MIEVHSDGQSSTVATVGPGDVAMCELLVERLRDTARRV